MSLQDPNEESLHMETKGSGSQKFSYFSEPIIDDLTLDIDIGTQILTNPSQL